MTHMHILVLLLFLLYYFIILLFTTQGFDLNTTKLQLLQGEYFVF